MRKWIAAVALAGCGDVGTQDRDAQVIHIDAPPEDGAGPGDTYSAFALFGGLDRVVIVKTRASADTCFGITLRSPSQMMPAPGVVLPIGWEVEIAQALRPAAACNPSYDGPIIDGAGVKNQSGFIDWPGSSIPPAITKVDVTLELDMPSPSFPPSERLDASNLPLM